MKIAVIGAGNGGETLDLRWARAGHDIVIGARDPNSHKIKKVTSQNRMIKVKSIQDASAEAEVILIAAASNAIREISKQLGVDRDKVSLLEQFALVWVDLAIFQKQGRNIAIKILKR